MELIGNLTLQFFAYVILPVLLPIFIFSILVGIRSPERLIGDVFDLMQSIVSTVLRGILMLLQTLLKFILANKNKTRYPKAQTSNWNARSVQSDFNGSWRQNRSVRIVEYGENQKR